jgi:hypothetical protein
MKFSKQQIFYTRSTLRYLHAHSFTKETETEAKIVTCSNILEDKLLTGLCNGPHEEEVQTEKKRKHKLLCLHFFLLFFCVWQVTFMFSIL